MLGAQEACPCYRREFSGRVPFFRFKAFSAAADNSRGFGDIWEAMASGFRECGRGLELGPWPASIKRSFLDGCSQKGQRGAATCDCLLVLAQQKQRYTDYMAFGAAIKAGGPLPDDMKDIFTGEEAMSCFAVTADASWPATSEARLVSECEARAEFPAELCPCIMQRMMSTISWPEMALLASGRDGGEAVQAKVEANAPTWALDCAETATDKRKKKRR